MNESYYIDTSCNEAITKSLQKFVSKYDLDMTFNESGNQKQLFLEFLVEFINNNISEPSATTKLALDCVRISTRFKVDIKAVLQKEFLANIFYLCHSVCENDIVVASLRCLTNILHDCLESFQVFLDISGLQWLTDSLKRPNAILHLFYYVRLLYMIITQRTQCIDPMIEAHQIHSVLTITACYIFHSSHICSFPHGGVGRSRGDSLREVMKCLYALAASPPPPLTSNQILYGCGSVSPSPSGTNDGASGSAVAGPASPFLSLLFCVLVAEGGADCTHAFREVLLELRLLSLQLLMLAPPTQADFERVCMGLASKCHVEGGTHSHVEGGTHSQVEACTRRLAASVVRVLEVQFLRCGECSEKKLRTESFASAVVPGLAVLTHMAALSPHARGWLYHTIVTKSLPASKHGSNSADDKSTSEEGGGAEARERSMHPKIAPLEYSLLHKLLQLMTGLEHLSKRTAEELVFVMCNQNVDQFVEVAGMGNAIALLRIKNLI